jgi:hypothetical protein
MRMKMICEGLVKYIHVVDDDVWWCDDDDDDVMMLVERCRCALYDVAYSDDAFVRVRYAGDVVSLVVLLPCYWPVLLTTFPLECWFAIPCLHDNLMVMSVLCLFPLLMETRKR